MFRTCDRRPRVQSFWIRIDWYLTGLELYQRGPDPTWGEETGYRVRFPLGHKCSLKYIYLKTSNSYLVRGAVSGGI